MSENLTIITTKGTTDSDSHNGLILNPNVVYGPMFESFVEDREKKGISPNSFCKANKVR